MPGPFYFAWVDPTETTFGPEHEVEDELIYSAKLQHDEGGFAQLTMDVRNPRVGLLAPGRKVWAWFSWYNGTSVVPLFFGRLVGLPSNLIGEAITLEFIAKPGDYAEQKAAIAEGLKVRPFYDPVFISEDKRDDPDTVLEGYSALWHVDRVTLQVSVSDILLGEDGEQDFQPYQAYYDSVQISFNETPLREVSVEATVDWDQTGIGSGAGFAVHEHFQTWTGDGFISGWPKPGAGIAGGWQCLTSDIKDLSDCHTAQAVTRSGSWSSHAKEHQNGDATSMNVSWTRCYAPGLEHRTSFEQVIGNVDAYADPPVNESASLKWDGNFYVGPYEIECSMTLGLDPKETRGRTEQLFITMQADSQAIVTDPTDQGETQKITVTGSKDLIDVTQPGYFATDRGMWSIEYLLCLARVHLLARARAVKVNWDCRMEQAILLSCRKNARLHDRRLPGGVALGKVVSYGFDLDGDNGKLIGNCTIACSIGYGNYAVIGADDGDPVYVEPGVLDGVQAYVDHTVVLESQDFGYAPPIQDPNIPIVGAGAILSAGIIGATVDEQYAALVDMLSTPKAIGPGAAAEDQLDQKQADDRTAQKQKDQLPDRYFQMVIKPVKAYDYSNAYDVVPTQLVIPMMIDLEAPSGPEIALPAVGRTQLLFAGYHYDLDVLYGTHVKGPQQSLVFGSVVIDADAIYGPRAHRVLVPGFLTSADVFYAPALTQQGYATLLPGAVSHDDAFFAPAVLGALQPSWFVETDTVYPFTFAGGALTLVPGLYAEGDNFFGPTIATTDQFLTAGHVTDSDSFFVPTATNINTLTPALLASDDNILADTIARIISPPAYVNAGTLGSGTAASITPPLPTTRTNGNLLIAWCQTAISTVYISNITVSSGWTLGGVLTSGNTGDGFSHAGAWAYRYVDGTEAAPVFTFTTLTGLNPNTFGRVVQFSGVADTYCIGRTASANGVGTALSVSGLVSQRNSSTMVGIELVRGSSAIPLPTGFTTPSGILLENNSSGSYRFAYETGFNLGVTGDNLSSTITSMGWTGFLIEVLAPLDVGYLGPSLYTDADTFL